MSTQAQLIEHLLEQLDPLGDVTAKRMFGGHRIFRSGLMFALVAEGVVFLKADAKNTPEFEDLAPPPSPACPS